MTTFLSYLLCIFNTNIGGKRQFLQTHAWAEWTNSIVRRDDVDWNTFGFISAVANRLHNEYEKGVYAKSIVMKFKNKRMPAYHNCQREMLAHADAKGFAKIYITTKPLKVIKQQFCSV